MTQRRRAQRDEAPQEQPAAEEQVDLLVDKTVVVEVDRNTRVIEQEIPHPHYTLGQWRGHTRYICNYCPFDTLDQGTADSHWAKHFQDKSAVEQERRARLGIAITNSSSHVVGEV